MTSPTTLDAPPGRGFSRRSFLAGSAAAAAGVAVSTRFAFATPETPTSGDVIVCIFFRGGADGLSIVAPYMMPTYRSLRPGIRVKSPEEFTDPSGKAGLPLVQGGNVAPFDLSGTFALNPGMTSLHAGAWSDGHLAVVHAAGMPAGESDTRSHFDSMKNWEVGTASMNYTTGFLNRYLAGQSGVDRLAAIGRGSNLQRSLAGAVASYSMTSIAGFNVSGYSDNTRARNTLSSWYDADTGDLLLQTGCDTLAALGTVAAIDFSQPQYQPQNGAVYPDGGLAEDLKEAAQLVRADVGLRCVAIDFGGWDTHENMGAPEDGGSYFRGHVAELSDALSAFYTDLGSLGEEVTTFTMSEFGRTINENGNGGTDHGRGSCMFVMGGKVKGGVYGSFPGSIADGPEGDLTVLNDYRRVVSEILSVRGDAANLGSVFPTYTQEAPFGLCLA